MNGIEQLVESAKGSRPTRHNDPQKNHKHFAACCPRSEQLTDIVSLMEKANQLEEQEAADERKKMKRRRWRPRCVTQCARFASKCRPQSFPRPWSTMQAPNVSVAAPVVNYTPPAINLPAPTVTVTERSLKGAEWQFDIEHHGPGRTTINAKRIA